jgi:hypothetical protein
MDVQAFYRCRRKSFFFLSIPSIPLLIETAQLHSFILPIMQGYCQISQFRIPSDPADEDSTVDYMIISRRSRYRPGLRYQRRGIDDEAHVANFVETETIMRVEVSFPVCDSTWLILM